MQWDPDYTQRGGSEKYSNAGRPALAQGNPTRMLKREIIPEVQQFVRQCVALKAVESEGNGAI
ncbi:MAG: hypothetical protein CME32_07165 [Gimesia sp.]|nr:hypothetical protein [Gimesia sp.]